MEDEQASRRRFIATVAGASVVALSGCGSGGSETDEPDDDEEEEQTATLTGTTATAAGKTSPTATPSEAPDPTPTATPTEADTPTATPTDSPTPTATATPSASSLSNWPTYMYNNQNWGVNPDTTGPRNDVSVAWQRDLDAAQVNATPVLADGTLYVGDGRHTDDQGTLYALDPLSGRTRWSVTLDGPVVGGAVVDESGWVYAAASRDFVAYQPDGTEVWSFRGNAGLNFASPTVADGYVYFPADNGTLFKIETLSSERDWTYSVSGTIPCAPIHHEGTIYLPSRDGSITALDESANEHWTVEFHDPVNGLSMRDGMLFAAIENGQVVKIATNGNMRWSHSTGGAAAATPAVTGDMVYVGTRDDAVVAIDRGDGVEQWRYEESNNPFTAPPVVVDGTVYVGGQDHNVYALDAETGEELWSFATDDNIVDPAPVVSGNTVFIGSRDGKFYALSG